MKNSILVSIILFNLLWSESLTASEPPLISIEDALVHVRTTPEREWAWFPEKAETQVFERRFESASNPTPWTLTLRQQNVKQTWELRLNDEPIGRLVRDENDMQVDFLIPVGGVKEGENHLVIRQKGNDADDIRLGQVRLYAMSPSRRRGLANVEMTLVGENGNPVPGKITITNHEGTLIPVGAESNNVLAVRQGVVYTLSGKASFGIVPGEYRIVATRGFEYSMAEVTISPSAGQKVQQTLKLRREVDTGGWVASDTHVHTVTYSGHGDCSIEERMVTLAGEGIELPIATDHNRAIDYRAIAKSLGADLFFTPVIGDECTTKKGHFNIWPILPDSELPDHNQTDWEPLLADIRSTPDVRVAILNHARDVHSGFRPFSPAHHVGLTGERLDGQSIGFNAMEICNSGAVQTDAMQLFRDWCGLINRGLEITPVGSSDSHDVSRYIVGQGRTYIRCDDSRPDRINVKHAVEAFRQGRVIVSYGLLVRLTVNQIAQPGDLASLDSDEMDLEVTAEVLGPDWTRADSVALYVCGHEKFRQAIDHNTPSGSPVKARVTWRIPHSEYTQDVWLAAVAMGPGINESYWKTALPYQPTSNSFSPYVFSSTGPIRIDIDGDAKFTSSYQYAQELVAKHTGDPAGLSKRLLECETSVVHQVASLVRNSGDELDELESHARGHVAAAISDYRQAYRQSVIAKLEGTE